MASDLHTWSPGKWNYTPPDAVIAGHDSDGSTIYVGRAYHDGELLPAKVIPSKGSIYVSWGGHDYFKDQFEVLTGYGYHWVPGHHTGEMPSTAVSTGRTLNNYPVYVGRGHHNDSLTPGKVYPFEYSVYIAYAGKEVKIRDYELLVKTE